MNVRIKSSPRPPTLSRLAGSVGSGNVFVAQLQDHLTSLRLCDQNGLIRTGIALEEALLNGMYHGNLEVGSELRQQDESAFHAMINTRRGEAPYKDRRVYVDAKISPAEAAYTIRDEGHGFHGGVEGQQFPFFH